MKLTFNVTTDQAFVICELIANHIRYAHDKYYHKLSKEERMSLMNRLRGTIPQFFQEAENDAMRPILEKAAELLNIIESEMKAIENEQKEEQL